MPVCFLPYIAAMTVQRLVCVSSPSGSTSRPGPMNISMAATDENNAFGVAHDKEDKWRWMRRERHRDREREGGSCLQELRKLPGRAGTRPVWEPFFYKLCPSTPLPTSWLFVWLYSPV